MDSLSFSIILMSAYSAPASCAMYQRLIRAMVGHILKRTLSASGREANSKASTACSIGNILLIISLTLTLPSESALSAGPNGPQREPITVISFMTRGARFIENLSATVVFTTIVPRGLTSDRAVSNPAVEPVQSTTRSADQVRRFFRRLIRSRSTYRPALRESELFGKSADKQHVCACGFEDLRDQQPELSVAEDNCSLARFDRDLFKYFKRSRQRLAEDGRLDG